MSHIFLLFAVILLPSEIHRQAAGCAHNYSFMCARLRVQTAAAAASSGSSSDVGFGRFADCKVCTTQAGQAVAVNNRNVPLQQQPPPLLVRKVTRRLWTTCPIGCISLSLSVHFLQSVVVRWLKNTVCNLVKYSTCISEQSSKQAILQHSTSSWLLFIIMTSLQHLTTLI